MNSTDSLWFEDLVPGRIITLPDIDCGAERIARHADLFDARHPINTSANNRFGRPIAHGPHPVAQALASLGDAIGAPLVALEELGPWRFLSPAFVGDLLRAEAVVVARRAARDTGDVTFDFRLTAAADRICQQGLARLIVRRRPRAPDGGRP
jgi:acyl dehydratase